MAIVINRAEIEARLARVMGRDLRREFNKIMDLLGDPPDLSNVPSDYWSNGWRDIQADLEPILVDIFLEQAQTLMDETTIGVSWDQVNQTAADWARRHTEQTLRDMYARRYQYLSTTIPRYYEEGWNLGRLRKELERWYSPVRAEMIAITETTRAATEGERALIAQMRRELGVELVPIWNTQNDERVCPICGPRHSKPIDDGFYPPAHPNCLVGDTRVLAEGISAGSKRWYQGDIVTIETLENNLSVTPNHPILTLRGWVGAGNLIEGDYILGYSASDWIPALIEINNKYGEATVENIFSSLDINGFRVPVSPPDFHNDGAGSEVAIIRANSEVMNNVSTQVFEPTSQLNLAPGHVVSHIPLTHLSSDAKLFKRDFSPPDSLVSSGDLLFSLLSRHSFPFDALSFRVPPWVYAIFEKATAKCGSVDTSLFSKAVFGLSGSVTIQEVVKITDDYFSGHVYNLQTNSEMYVANGIITHNCRCWTTYTTPEVADEYRQD